MGIKAWVRAWLRPTPMWCRRPPGAQGETSGVLDAVAADPVVGVETFAGGGFGAGCVGGAREKRWL
jgi:hypothetical protein